MIIERLVRNKFQILKLVSFQKSETYTITRTSNVSRFGTIKVHDNINNDVSSKQIKIEFSDPIKAYQSKTFPELIRNYIVFSICQNRWLVKNSEVLMRLSYHYLGNRITDTILRSTFFGHFCAGENEVTIKPTIDYLQRNGIGSILDYAAESDVQEVDNKSLSESPNKKVECRVYDYKNEELCDLHLRTFEKCIKAVKSVSPTGFAAIKCTALGDPELLKRASVALVELRKLFLKFDIKGTGYVTKNDFIVAYDKFFIGGDVNKVFEQCDLNKDGCIDYIEWSNGLELEELHKLTMFCRESGPLANAVLDENERQLMKRMRERIDSLAQLAQTLGVRLMIDAEHTYFQPAIDNISTVLIRKYNIKYPAIFATYQMYLKDSKLRLATDMERARKGNYKFAAKLVRGAYMTLERAYAKQHNLPDPINETIGITHDNYNSAVEDVIRSIASGDNFEIMIATHNQKSVELAVNLMNELKLPPSSGVYFGQLLGMSDNITFSLGREGYKAYKYVPYGIIREVMPYLIRRAQENSDALSSAKIELKMLRQEILRRLSGN